MNLPYGFIHLVSRQHFSKNYHFFPPDTYRNFAYVRNGWSLFSHIKSHFYLHCLRNISLETTVIQFSPVIQLFFRDPISGNTYLGEITLIYTFHWICDPQSLYVSLEWWVWLQWLNFFEKIIGHYLMKPLVASANMTKQPGSKVIHPTLQYTRLLWRPIKNWKQECTSKSQYDLSSKTCPQIIFLKKHKIALKAFWIHIFSNIKA